MALTQPSAQRVASRILGSGESRVLYFAYGHHMNPLLMRETAPAAIDLGGARLEGHTIDFSAVSPGKDTTWATLLAVEGQETWGVLYAITLEEVAGLDVQESGYRRETRMVVTQDGLLVDAQVHIAVERALTAHAPLWCLLSILREATRRSFPKAYVDLIEAVGGPLSLMGRRYSTGYFNPGDEVLFGKYKNKRGRILRFFVDERGVPMMEIEPVPKGRKQNKLMGLYNVWHLPDRRLPKRQAVSIVASYSDDFMRSVEGKRFRHPDTGRRVLFKSLPAGEQKKIHKRWSDSEKMTERGERRVDALGQEISPERRKALQDAAAKSDDELELMDTDELDRIAFGFASGDVREVPLDKLHVVYDADIENAEHEVGNSPKKWEPYLDEPIEVKLKGGRLQIEEGHHRFVTAKRLGRKTLRAEIRIDDNPIKAIRELAGSGKTASLERTACIIAGRKFGQDIWLLKNRDRGYDAQLQVFHMEFAGVEMAFVLDLETGYLEGVNEYGIGVVNTTLMVLHDEQEGKSSGKGKKTLKSKDGPKIFLALTKRTLQEAVTSLVQYAGGIRGHTFVSDGRDLFSIECTRTHPAQVRKLDPDRTNTRTNHGVAYPDAGYTHGDDYVSSVVRRWEAQKRLQKVESPLEAPPSLTKLVADPDSPFNPVRVTEHMRTTSQLLIDTTHPALVLYLIPGHATLKPSLNLLPGSREPKIPVRVFRYKRPMEERKKTAAREVLDLRVIEKLRQDFLMLMKNVSVVKNYDQALRWKEAVNFWRERFSNYLYKALRKELGDLGFQGAVMTRQEAKYWQDKIGKETWSLYSEFRVPLDLVKSERDLGRPADPEYLFSKMVREFPKWEGRVRRAARQAWTVLKDFVSWFEQRIGKKMTLEVPSEERHNLEGFQVLVKGYSSERYEPEQALERFRVGLRLYKQRARAVLPWLVQHQLPLVLDFNMDMDEGGTYHGTFIDINAQSSQEHPGAMVRILAHEMAHHLYKHYLSGEDRKFWDAAITGNYGKLDLREVLRRYGHSNDGLFYNRQIEREDPILSLQIDGLMYQRELANFVKNVSTMEHLRKYLEDGGEAEFVVHGKPITGYAHKNHEEAFCDAVGMLVGYGPQAVLPEVRQWLKTILPSLKTAGDVTAQARYKSKKTVKTKDGDDMVVYEYGPRQVANRNKAKAERVEKLRKQISQLRAKVRRDLEVADDHTRDLALAVALMDATYERVGNSDSAQDGHFGVTTWRVKHVQFKGKKAVFTYVGKSGVDHVKEVDNPKIVSALKKACDGKKNDACLVDVDASDVNEYLKPFDVTAKDLRGFHANREMKERLKALRAKGPDLPRERKDKDEILKMEFDKALAETAEVVGHTKSTLRSQYLVPGLEDDYLHDGSVSTEHTKDASSSVLQPTGERSLGGQVLTMPLRDDSFIHFTPSSRALEILRSKRLLMHPPHQKFGLDAVSAVSTTYGKFVPGVQTTHIKGEGETVALLFKTNTLPERGYLEEVLWNQDVVLVNPRVLSMGRAVSMLRSTPATIGEQDMVVYNRPTTRVASTLRNAAARGTPLERKMLAAASHAPVFVARDRRWWLTHAPNIYRIARDFERPRPYVEGLCFPSTMFATLWYEDQEGHRVGDVQLDDFSAPEGAHTQHSQFPTELRHSILVLNDDGTSSSLGAGVQTYSSDLVTAMVRSGDWDVADAIMVAGQSCERCMNVLHHHYETGVGYPFGSDSYWKAGTVCKMCRGVVRPSTKTASPKSSKQATKTPAEREDDKVQKMLHPEPKKKPPRHDLRDHRTLEDDDEDFDGLGGGDRGDRDMSLKWNKVGRRVAFRWLAVAERPSAFRVAFLRQAKDRDRSEFEKDVARKKFRHPDTGNEVSFKSLPTEEQSRIYEAWRRSKHEEEDTAEDLTDEAEEGDEEEDTAEDLTDEAEERDEGGSTDEDEDGGDADPEEAEAPKEPEGGKPYSNSDADPKGDSEEQPAEDSEEKPRTKEDVTRELNEARDRIEDLEAHITRIKGETKDGRDAIKELLKLVEKASEQNKATIQQKVKEEKQKLRDLDDDLDVKQAQLKDAQKLVKALKEERRSPEGVQQPPRKPKPKKPAEDAPREEDSAADETPEERDAETLEQAERAVSDARSTMESLLGAESDVARDLQHQIEKTLQKYNNRQIQEFSESLRRHMQKLVALDPNSPDAITLANNAARLEDLGGESNPSEMAERLAGMAYARNVVANPMVLNGEPVGGHEMDSRKYGERASEAFEHYRHLHKSLRRHAAEQIERELRELEPDSNKAQELNAILTGMNTAHVADTGEALPGRPQPSAGHTALVRKLVETGNANHMFKPLEDFFSDDSRKAMSEALREMNAGEIGNFILGEDENHPFSSLKETLDAPGISEYKQLVKDFLIQDFLNDTWGDRAVRDMMEAAGAEGSDDPAVRAKVLAEAKQQAVGPLHEALAAMERVTEARGRGEAPDPQDEDLVRETFEGDDAPALRHSVGTLLKTLRSKFQKHVVSPALAVLDHFVKHRDPEVLGQETLPHPDASVEEHKGTSGDEDHGPGEVWRTDRGNWRAKNDEGTPKTFSDRAEADEFAGAHDDWSAKFDVDSGREGPSRFATSLAEAWLRRIRQVHPDDPERRRYFAA